MNYKAVPYKKRNHPSIEKYSEMFVNYMKENDVENAARCVVLNTFELHGAEGLMNILDHANLYIKRRKYIEKHCKGL